MSKPTEPKFPKQRYSTLFGRNLVAPDGYYLLREGPVTAADLSFYAQGWLSLEGTEEPVDLDPRYAYTYARKLPDGQQNDDLPAGQALRPLKFPKQHYNSCYGLNVTAPDGSYLLAGEAFLEAGDLSFSVADGWEPLLPDSERRPGTICEGRAVSPQWAWTFARKLPDGQRNDDLPAAEEENGICDAAELRDLQGRGTAAPFADRELMDRIHAFNRAAMSRYGSNPPDDTETLLGLIREFTPVVLSHFSGNPARSVALAAAMARAALEEARKGITAQPSAPATVQPPHPDAPRLQMTHDGKVTAFGAIEAPPGYYLLPAGETAEPGDLYVKDLGGWGRVDVGQDIIPTLQFTYARKLPATDGPVP